MARICTQTEHIEFRNIYDCIFMFVKTFCETRGPGFLKRTRWCIWESFKDRKGSGE